ncbi:protein ALTERED XYLOGLUCAN 4 [Artemisia annua]|uniref:Protein ALTERED XYLOGLUCAN 4 n=1 Tax=Artemisia annua TaxID=35608 RepID=A0A2U1NUE5_ARTAN|nr:protein ALTERED XYLOGLUCAN 4 [Artemisia annua]
MLRTFSPSHFENGTWDNGGNCNRTNPLKDYEVESSEFYREISRMQNEEIERANKECLEKEKRFKVMDITMVMAMRADGHPRSHWGPTKNNGFLISDGKQRRRCSKDSGGLKKGGPQLNKADSVKQELGLQLWGFFVAAFILDPRIKDSRLMMKSCKLLTKRMAQEKVKEVELTIKQSGWASTNSIGNLDIQDAYAIALNKLGHKLQEITEQCMIIQTTEMAMARKRLNDLKKQKTEIIKPWWIGVRVKTGYAVQTFITLISTESRSARMATYQCNVGLPYVLPFRANDLDLRWSDDGLRKWTANFVTHVEPNLRVWVMNWGLKRVASGSSNTSIRKLKWVSDWLAEMGAKTDCPIECLPLEKEMLHDVEELQ